MKKYIEKENRSFSQEYGIIALLIIVLFSAWTRFEGVKKETPLTFDEGVYLRLGAQLAKDPTNYSTIGYYNYLVEKKVEVVPGYLNNPLFKHPPLYPYFISLSFRIFGRDYKAARYVSFFFGILTIIIVYFIVKEIFDERRAILAALFVAADPVHWFCSEKVWIESTYVFFVYLGILLLILGLKKNEKFLVLSGMVFGLSMMSKYFAVLSYIGMLIFTTFILENIRSKKYSILFLLTPILVMLPWFLWNYQAYGGDVFFNIIKSQLNTYTEGGQRYLTRYAMIAVSLFAIFSLSVLGRILLDDKLLKIKLFIGHVIQNKIFKQITFIISAILCILIFIKVFYVNKFYFSYMPIDGNFMDFFKNEPRIFYMKRLVELSPIYLLGIMSLLFIKKWNKYNLLLVLTMLPTIVFFSYFGAYESRYILAAIPALAMLSSDTIVRFYDVFKNSSNSLIKSLRFVLLILFMYLIFKVIRFDFSTIINNPTMFLL